ncbi:transposable element Tcb2 transposase [Trichonephila clavipes]|nr:transposable element Tcb2 transposase [Trichonephila clavipes]
MRVGSVCHRIVDANWRESGTAYRPENIQEKDRYPTCSIMVWAGITINGRTCLHVVANGTMTGQRYIDEVLLPHVRLFRGAVGDKFVFMDDNATYLNPIENVWDALGRQVAGRNYPPTNKNTLIRALTEEWDKLPQQLLDNVVQSMGCPPFEHISIPNREAWSRNGVLLDDTNYQMTFPEKPSHSPTIVLLRKLHLKTVLDVLTRSVRCADLC